MGMKMGNFYTDIISKDPRFTSTARIDATDLLEPETLRRVLAVIEDAKALGWNLMIFETYRSNDRQQMLYEQGATKLRQVGVHHYGLACDVVKSINGAPSWKGDFSFLAEISANHGLIWGGNWGSPGQQHNFVDNVHLQRCSLAMQPALFKDQWYPDDSYNPLKS